MMIRNVLPHLAAAACLALLLSGCSRDSEKFTNGIGIYPGDPAEDYSPDLIPEKNNYRNLARLRPAYHSSSWDYNLTAQLVTDGISTDAFPSFISLTTSDGDVPRNEREWLLDHNRVTTYTIDGSNVWLELYSGGAAQPAEITSVEIRGEITYDPGRPMGWKFILSGSDDGFSWATIDESGGSGLPGRERADPYAMMMQEQARDSTGQPIDFYEAFFGPTDPGEPRPSFAFSFDPPEPSRIVTHVFTADQPVAYKKYRVSLNTGCAKSWTLSDLEFYCNDAPVEMVPSHSFTSAWMSAGTGREWIYADLGVRSDLDRVKLHWVNKALEGSVQVSDDAETWSDVATLPGSEEKTDEITLPAGTTGRYVRIMMNTPANGTRYILSEMEVLGTGGMKTVPAKSPSVSGNKMYLSGGNWRLQRASLTEADGETVSKAGFECPDWVVATVPGTVLTSYLRAGALPDPNYGANQLMISESFFLSDFWYRNEFVVPAELNGERYFLNFDGINWKADVFVNGTKAGDIEGAFIRGKFDVTELILPGSTNAIAVLIRKNDNPGVVKEQTAFSTDRNGGVLGADNPTYHASIGWDWIPTIRGRDIGIWNDVWINTTGAVMLEDPFVYADLDLPDTSAADLHIEVTLKNNGDKTVEGTLRGKYGEIPFEERISLAPASDSTVVLDASSHPGLRMLSPRLWWPRGYGDPYLYDVDLSFVTDDGKVSDTRRFRSGIREMSFTEDKGILYIYINGRRFIARGGNWGFPESNLNYRAREYDIAVAYHADMNFTMIRNWVAQTADEEFFEACDRHGIMVWQDFCLANPADGPDPDDPDMFLKNAADVIRQIRNHPSVGIYVGRNEGNPPVVIDTALRTMVPGLHPGLYYISHSSAGVVSGGGPYRALPVKDYYLLYGRNKLHSERGMPNVMNYESLRMMLPDSAIWPQNSMWGLHDYTLESAQSCASFNEMIEKGFGTASSAREFTELAQWINYDGYRTMFEGRSRYRQGLLLWMSHPAWPSMVWQTYDYYFDPTAAYFGCKKASEPLHIQWNRVWDDIEVVNLSGGNRSGLTARAQIINMDGSVQWEKEAVTNSNDDTTLKLFRLEFPPTLSDVHFIKLTLSEDGEVVSENFYWRGLDDGDYKALRGMPDAVVSKSTVARRSGDEWVLKTTLTNTSEAPALMLRLKVTGETTGERILPVFFSDNYLFLMPGEEKVITVRLKNRDTRGEKPVIELSGFNI